MELVAHWSAAWDAAKAANEEGFGSEDCLFDWTESIEAFNALRQLGPSYIAPLPQLFPERRWQPVAAYPNDGTPVLGFSPELLKHALSGGFMVIHRDGPKPFGGAIWFTHWMPLPEAPK